MKSCTLIITSAVLHHQLLKSQPKRCPYLDTEHVAGPRVVLRTLALACTPPHVTIISAIRLHHLIIIILRRALVGGVVLPCRLVGWLTGADKRAAWVV